MECAHRGVIIHGRGGRGAMGVWLYRNLSYSQPVRASEPDAVWGAGDHPLHVGGRPSPFLSRVNREW